MNGPPHLVGVTLAGAAFAIAWTPCTGPFLGQVLSLASQPITQNRSVVAVHVRFGPRHSVPPRRTLPDPNHVDLPQVRDHWRIINLIAGAITILLGILVATGRFTVITQKISSLGIGL